MEGGELNMNGELEEKFKKLNSEIGDDDDQLLAERIGTSDFCSLSSCVHRHSREMGKSSCKEEKERPHKPI